MGEKDLAYEDWKKGLKYKDIAAKYSISLNTVKSWATRYWKQEKLQPKKNKIATKNSGRLQPKTKKVGAPVGNKNAVGNSGGAPEGNKNSVTHGAYESIYWDSLNDTERSMIQSMRFDEESMLIEQMQLLSFRERRLLHKIKEAENRKGGLALDSITKRELQMHGGNKSQTEITTHTISTFEVIQKLEAELTKVQGRKTKCIESLDKIRKGREELDIKKREIAMKEKEMEQSEQTYIEDLEPLAEMINRK